MYLLYDMIIIWLGVITSNMNNYYMIISIPISHTNQLGILKRGTWTLACRNYILLQGYFYIDLGMFIIKHFY